MSGKYDPREKARLLLADNPRISFTVESSGPLSLTVPSPASADPTGATTDGRAAESLVVRAS